MIDFHAAPPVLLLPIWSAAGLMLGLAYFRALRATADLLVGGGRPLLALALTLSRFACLGLGLFAAAHFGGLALLAALAGILCAKAVMMRRIRSEHA